MLSANVEVLYLINYQFTFPENKSQHWIRQFQNLFNFLKILKSDFFFFLHLENKYRKIFVPYF